MDVFLYYFVFNIYENFKNKFYKILPNNFVYIFKWLKFFYSTKICLKLILFYCLDDYIDADLDTVINQNIQQKGAFFTCLFCGKEAKGKIIIQRHIESYHVNSGGQDCLICGFHSKTRHSMYEHQRRVHSELRTKNKHLNN